MRRVTGRNKRLACRAARDLDRPVDTAEEAIMTDLRFAVLGAAGRMGLTLVRTIKEAPGCSVAAAIERPGSIALGQDVGLLAGAGKLSVKIVDDMRAGIAAADAVLDFTAPAATLACARLAAEMSKIHVIGTTGCTAADDAEIAKAAARARIVKAGNMSLGVNLIVALTRKIAEALDEDFDIEVVEMHHRMKVDAPSGTALMLGRAAAEGRKVDLGKKAVYSREGHTGPRERGSIGFATLRGGNVVGEHAVVFAGEHERVEIAHKATDRSIYARGAVKAALWAKGKGPGLYSMADVLGLA
jgi:4-hydroxy-tetrahydrodipicolinate reductase